LINKIATPGKGEIYMIKKINLQLFAEGDTNPEDKKDTNLDNKPEEVKPFASTIRSMFGLKEKEPKKEPEPAKVETKPDDKPVEKTKQEEPAKEPEFDEILYNKEKVKIPVTERQTYLQKGYNYDKVKADAEAAKATLLRVAKAEGFKTVDEYLAELGNREKAKLAEQIEEAAGDPDKIDEIVQNHPVVKQTREAQQKLEFEKTITKLKEDTFFKEVEPTFNVLMEQNPTAAPDLVYKIARNDYLTPAKISELIAKEKASAVQTTIADVHDKERRAAPKGGDAGDGKDVVTPTSFGSKLSEAFGLDKTHAQKAAQRSHEKLKRS